MAKRIQDGKHFYHITSLKNLEGIFQYGLLSRPDAISKGILKTDIANKEIIEKRKELNILQYVPFHFFEPTPFTGAIFNTHPLDAFCSITITREFAKKNNFKICTAHPLSKNPMAEIMDFETGLKSINWEKAEERNYHDDISKNACMAECLAVSPVSPADFAIIFVSDENALQYVDNLAKKIIGDYLFDIMVNPYLSKAGI